MRSDVYENCLNVINNCSVCSVLFLSIPGLFPALRKRLKHLTASHALKFHCMLEITLSCSKTVLSMLNHRDSKMGVLVQIIIIFIIISQHEEKTPFRKSGQNIISQIKAKTSFLKIGTKVSQEWYCAKATAQLCCLMPLHQFLLRVRRESDLRSNLRVLPRDYRTLIKKL